MIKKFSFPLTKSPTDFFAQNSLQFGRRARRSWRGDIDNSSLVLVFGKIRTHFKENC